MTDSANEAIEWAHHAHPLTLAFQAQVAEMIAELDRRGRGQDLDRVAAYTQQPRGEVSRLTAVFWTIDEDYQKPLRELIDSYRQQAEAALGLIPDDTIIYELMYAIYRKARCD